MAGAHYKVDKGINTTVLFSSAGELKSSMLKSAMAALLQALCVRIRALCWPVPVTWQNAFRQYLGQPRCKGPL